MKNMRLFERKVVRWQEIKRLIGEHDLHCVAFVNDTGDTVINFCDASPIRANIFERLA